MLSSTPTSFDRLYKYQYSHIKSLAKYEALSKEELEENVAYDALLSSYYGEIFEYDIYEQFMLWASKDKGVEFFILKGPYVKDAKRKSIGFYYDKKHEIYYASHNVVLAEFDAFFAYKGCIYFVEMTTTDVAKSITKLCYEIVRKNNFLRHLFPNYKNNCIIVTTYEGKIEMPDLPELIVLRVDKRTYPEFDRSQIDTGYMNPRYASNLIHIDDIVAEPYDYYNHLYTFHQSIRSFPNKLSFDEMIQSHHNHRGMLKRLFLSVIRGKEMSKLLNLLEITAPEKVKITNLFLTLKTNYTYTYEPHLYLECSNHQLYEVKLSNTLNVKLVDKKRRTHKDIKKLRAIINQHSAEATLKILETVTPKKENNA